MARKTKKILSVVLVVLICAASIPMGGFVGSNLGFFASALDATGSCGENVTYTFDSASGALTLSGTGKTYDYSPEDLPPFFSSGEIKSVAIGENITGIGDCLFAMCGNIETVSFPSTLETIGDSSFFQCTSLKSVTIPDNVTEIKSEAFNGCSSLETINIGKGLNTINTASFALLSALSAINVNADNASFTAENNILFSKDKTKLVLYAAQNAAEEYSIPSTVGTVEQGAFCNAANLKKVTVPSSVTVIDVGVFIYCSSLTEVTIPESVTAINNTAFYGTALKDVYYGGTQAQWNSISIADGNTPLTNATVHCEGEDSGEETEEKTKIGDNVYYTVNSETGAVSITGTGKTYSFTYSNAPFVKYNIKSVVIGEGVTDIGTMLFSGCSSLETVTLPNTLQTIGVAAFQTTGIKSIVIPDNVTDIKGNAFNGCFYLESVAIGKSLKNITEGAFSNLHALKTVTVDAENKYFVVENNVLFSADKTRLIVYSAKNMAAEYIVPQTVNQIDSYAFFAAGNLERVTLPGSLETIGSFLFGDCNNLKEVTFTLSVKKIEYSAFSGTIISDIYFVGSEENWGEITVDPEGNEKLEDVSVHYANGKIGDDAYYVLNESTGAVTIAGTGETYRYQYDTTPFLDKNVTSVTVCEGITRIGSMTFANCKDIETISLPETLDSIGASAFQATSIKELIIPDSVSEIGSTAFNACNSLEKIVIGKGLKTLGSNTFSYEKNLKTIIVDSANENFVAENNVLFSKDKTNLIVYAAQNTMTKYIVPETVNQIDSFAFYQAQKLENVVVPYGVTLIDNSTFNYCNNLKSVFLPATVTSIGGSAFYNNPVLSAVFFGGSEEQWKAIEIDYPNQPLDKATIYYDVDGMCGESACYSFDKATGTLTVSGTGAIQNAAFADNLNIKKVVINKGITSTGKTAFAYCLNLESVSLPESFLEINSMAFSGTAVSEINIPASVTYIHNDAFSACYELEKITVDADNGKYSGDENGVLFNKDKTMLSIYPAGNSKTSYEIPNTVKIVGKYAFDQAQNLKTVGIPKSVTAIENYAFRAATKIEKFTVDADNVVYLSDENGVIYNKDKTELVQYPLGSTATLYVIADSVKTIKAESFRYASHLEDVIIQPNVEKIESQAFQGFGLKNVYYIGTAEQWNQITVEEKNFAFDNAAIHFCQKDMAGENAVCLVDEATGEAVIYGTGAIDAQAFMFDKRIKKLVIAQGITSIGAHAFDSCENLESVSLPDGLLEIKENAFVATAVTSINIPASVTSIGLDVFYCCDSLTEFTVDENSETYSSDENGVLFSKDKTKLIQSIAAINAESYEIPNTVKSIEKRAFISSNMLKNIIIPASVDSAANDAFDCTYSLQKFTVDENNKTYLSDENGVLFSKDKTVLVKYPLGKEQTLYEIPNTVKTVGNNAFDQACNLTRIIIPSSVEKIGAYAFDGSEITDAYYLGTSQQWKNISVEEPNTNWQNVTVHYVEMGKIGDNVSYILDLESGELTIEGTGETYDYDAGNKSPFSGKTNIKTVQIGENVTRIGDYLFFCCTNLETVKLPETLLSVGTMAFTSCKKIKSIVIPDNAETIEIGAFAGCASLESVSIGKNLKTLQTQLFLDTNIKTLTVNAENENYVAENNVLFSKDKTMLVFYASCKSETEYSIPESVVTIENSAFYGASNLEKVTVASGVKKIDEMVFAQCKALKEITIPMSVKTISEIAFQGSGLTDVYYIGTEEQWNEISIEERNEPLVNAQKHFAFDGKIGDNVYYSFDEETGTLTVSGTGVIYDYDINNSATPFFCNEKIKKVVVEEGITAIGDRLFYGCKNIESISLPNTLVSIGASFTGCDNLKTITVPNGVELIEDETFAGSGVETLNIGSGTKTASIYLFTNIKNVNVSEDNPYLSSENGVLFSKDKTVLVGYPRAKTETSYAVPESVTEIGNSAFNSSALTKLTFGEKVAKIGSYAFEYAQISEIEYSGCVGQWSKINISFGNDPFLAANVSCGEHSFGETIPEKEATVLEEGCRAYKICEGCGLCFEADADEKSTEGKADLADFVVEKPNPADVCDCACHSSNNFVKFFYSIISWFWKLFNIHKFCDCGLTHY